VFAFLSLRTGVASLPAARRALTLGIKIRLRRNQAFDASETFLKTKKRHICFLEIKPFCGWSEIKRKSPGRKTVGGYFNLGSEKVVVFITPFRSLW